ncbi:zinc ABC transporter substrate-binding protein [Aliisedimentitalea scapharcae]|uniref:High-affinity zinc uptake system protein ZnuA n=1 Tax=Aliisedimentitalea scapharcae TaxID=1524259 RepID=A0ABZ2XXF5_9RHOB
MRLPTSLIACVAATCSIVSTADAEVPQVVTDIAPIQSLVARVMVGVGEPEALLRPGESPHDYALRPSRARLLADADMVVWTGEALTPWLEQPLDTLAGDATRIELMAVEGTVLWPVRDVAVFEDHHDDDGHDDEGHDDDGHDGDGHDEGHADDHADDHDGDEQHGDDHDGDGDHEVDHAAHMGMDAHVWLDPVNGQLWLGVIAAELSRLDPDNSETYAANAQAGQAELQTAMRQIAEQLAPVKDRRFMVFHDAYQYFDRRFDLSIAAAVMSGDAAMPGAARVAEVRNAVLEQGITCAFAEPQFNPGLFSAVFNDGPANIAILDPVGAELATGAGLYEAVLRDLADNIAKC